MSKYTQILISFLVFTLSACAAKSPKAPQSIKPVARQTSAISAAEISVISNETTGPIDDCLMHSYLYSRLNNLTSECTQNYVHFFSKENFRASTTVDKKFVPDTKKVRIGSYNLFHLGDNQAPMKNMSLVAAVMNRWDIVGAQELMPLPSEWSINNQQLFNLISQNGQQVSFPSETWEVVKPGYLNLLIELQKLDPSWSLILQSQPEGEGSTGEMAGFFYRSRFVSLKEWTYCSPEGTTDIKSKAHNRNLACLIKVPESQKSLISRTAFAAYFQVGNFDFVGLTAHVRFSADMNLANIKAQSDYICKDSATPAKCKLPKDEAGRFYEIKVAMDQIAEFQKASGDKDIIYMGDTNLQMNAKSTATWAAALKPAEGFTVYQPNLTTLSVPLNKLASNYDHFLLSDKLTSECDTSSIQSYDYWKVADLKAPAAAQANDPVIASINGFLRADGQAKMLEQAEEQFAKLIKIQSNRQGTAIRPLNPKERSQLSASCNKAVARMKKNKTGALMELLSDHLPIEMNCKIDGRDDD